MYVDFLTLEGALYLMCCLFMSQWLCVLNVLLANMEFFFTLQFHFFFLLFSYYCHPNTALLTVGWHECSCCWLMVEIEHIFRLNWNCTPLAYNLALSYTISLTPYVHSLWSWFSAPEHFLRAVGIVVYVFPVGDIGFP